MYNQLRDKLSSLEFLQQLASNEGEKPPDPTVGRGGGMHSAYLPCFAYFNDFDYNVPKCMLM